MAERFEAFYLKPWKNDRDFAGLLLSLGRILPLQESSDFNEVKVRGRIHALTAGATARIFRLIETAAEGAIRSGWERIDIDSFGDDLILPLVSMSQASRRRPMQAAPQMAGR